MGRLRSKSVPWTAIGLALALVLSGVAAAESEAESEAKAGAGPYIDSSQAAGSATTRAGGFEIRWQTVSGGGGTASSASYQLRGTVGQHTASPDHPAEGDAFSHTGGFWALMIDRAEALVDRIFRDRFAP